MRGLIGWDWRARGISERTGLESSGFMARIGREWRLCPSDSKPGIEAIAPRPR